MKYLPRNCKNCDKSLIGLRLSLGSDFCSNKCERISKIKIVGDFAYIPLSREKESLVDLEDLERAVKFIWFATPNEMKGYYAMSKIEDKTVYLHRFIMNARKGQYVDHINFDTLDNRKSNLRIVTNQENTSHHKTSYNTSKLGIRGVSIQQTNNKNKLKLYVFRCHDTRHKLCKYFSLTEEGLELAKVLSEQHYKFT